MEHSPDAIFDNNLGHIQIFVVFKLLPPISHPGITRYSQLSDAASHYVVVEFVEVAFDSRGLRAIILEMGKYFQKLWLALCIAFLPEVLAQTTNDSLFSELLPLIPTCAVSSLPLRDHSPSWLHIIIGH